jgi:hypothetical protein
MQGGRMVTQNTSAQWRPAWLFAIAWLMAALACNLPPVVSPTATPAPVTPVTPESIPGVVTLEVINGTAGDICILYISYVSSATWGVNRLAGAGPIPPGESGTFDLPSEQYDLRAEGCDGGALGEERGLDLTVPLTYTFAAASAEPTSTPSPEVGPEPEGIVVWIYEECGQPSITPADEVIIRVGWVTASEELAESNADQMSFEVTVDGKRLGGVETVRYPARTLVMSDEFGCGPDEPIPIVFWDLPIGQLMAGTHTVSVEFFTGVQIYDGFDTYEAGSLGSLERTVVVSGGG